MASFLLVNIHQLCSRVLGVLRSFAPQNSHPVDVPVSNWARTAGTAVDIYWGDHTVKSLPFGTAEESKNYLEWRCNEYPLLREFMQLYGQRDGQIILDYGCGPGNDLVGFLIHTNAQKVIGMDISGKALGLAAHRLALHNIASDRTELVQISDAVQRIPLGDQTVDYINCSGVLHHTSVPQDILKEFYRVLKPHSRACIMVYNRNSLWFHLYTAYDKMVVKNAFSGLSLDEAFSKNTDGEACPISRCYRSEEFIGLCETAGFQAEFVGGYLSQHELNLLRALHGKALKDDRLADEHKEFLRGLVNDEHGYPMYNGKHAGIGGVYTLLKP